MALTSWDAAAFANCTLSRKLTASLGLRSDRDPYGRRIHLAPRASLSYAPTQRLTFSAAYGLYNQNLPLALVLQSPANKDLSPERTERSGPTNRWSTRAWPTRAALS